MLLHVLKKKKKTWDEALNEEKKFLHINQAVLQINTK